MTLLQFSTWCRIRSRRCLTVREHSDSRGEHAKNGNGNIDLFPRHCFAAGPGCTITAPLSVGPVNEARGAASYIVQESTLSVSLCSCKSESYRQRRLPAAVTRQNAPVQALIVRATSQRPRNDASGHQRSGLRWRGNTPLELARDNVAIKIQATGRGKCENTRKR